MFKGHQFIKLIDNHWVFDLTEFVGYKVKVDDNGNVISYKEAFEAEAIEEEIMFTKLTRVPLKVLKEAANQIRIYMNDLEDNNE